MRTPSSAVAAPGPYRGSAVETASGLLVSARADAGPLPRVPTGQHPREAMEAAIISALQRPPCVVSFSGGQDSSAVLAVATDVARRHGTPLPVPVTLRCRADRRSDESRWQEQVVRHLRLDDWERIEIDDELDIVGPYAGRVLRRHGPLWPFNTHFHLPIFDHAAGGSALTGVGGDQLFWRRRNWRVSMVLAGHVRPGVRDIPRVIRATGPQFLRMAELRARRAFPAKLPWLSPRVRRVVRRAWLRAVAAEPARYDDAVRETWWHNRVRLINDTSLALVARDVDTAVHHPLEDPAFIAAVLARVGGVGYRTRVHAMRDLFADLLPPVVVERRSKAMFDRVFWNEHSRAFGRSWDGTGVDAGLVNVDVLRDLWSQADLIHNLTWMMFQTAWLAADGQPVSPADREGSPR